MLSQLYNSLSSFSNGIFKFFGISSEYRILMMGLNESGKTTLMNRVINDTYNIIPKFGFSVEQFEFKNLNMVMWDIIGDGTNFKLWEYYYPLSNAIIFIVDSNDIESLNKSKKELFNLIVHNELKNKPLLVFANKQDVKCALSTTEVTDHLNLRLIEDRKWYIQPCSAITGDGIYEGFEWISYVLKQK